MPSDTHHSEFDEPASVVVFVVDVSCSYSHLGSYTNRFPVPELEYVIPPRCATSDGDNDFSEFLSLFQTYMLDCKPQNIVMLINMSKVHNELSNWGWVGETKCIESKLTRIRYLTKGRKVYMHYAQFLENNIRQHFVRELTDFIHCSLQDALALKTSELPKENEVDS